MKPAKGYERYFSVTDDGRVYSHRSNRFIKSFVCNGYLAFSTRFGGKNTKAKSLKIHRLVAETYIPNPNNLPFVNHIDGNKLNNSVSNLEWVTREENVRHAVELGLYKDVNINRGKLTRHMVSYIRAKVVDWVGTKESFYELWAIKLNVNKSVVKKAVLGVTYK